MRGSQERILELLHLFTSGQASHNDEQELFRIMEIEKNEVLIKDHIKKLLCEYQPDDQVPAANVERMYHEILGEINNPDIRPVVRKMVWSRWAAAASIILLLGTGYYFYANREQKRQQELAKVEQAKINNIAPPNAVHAVLTLSNGEKIILDSSGNGIVAKQGSVNVIKLDNGEIAYRGTTNEIQYNTLINPRGSKVINLTLSDGTRVWLNTESSLRYPTAFNGKERKVVITGEAYLEVSHNPAMPFIVSKGNTSIKVLGTHFNVNAYNDESSLNVTLIEGSVSVNTNSNLQPKVIIPGEQAQVNKNGRIDVTSSIDLNEVMSWKNGLFFFKGASIEDIMREVSRWYNVEVVFDGPVEEIFYAEISRNTNVSTLLQMLESTKAVHFKIEGKQIRVLSH
ncbi:MAG: FecR domain-containing protein [Flavitalea sp.]